MMHIQCGDVGQGSATEVLVFDLHGSEWRVVLRGMFAAARLACVPIEEAAGLAGEVWIARWTC
jgi:hypothetical protein